MDFGAWGNTCMEVEHISPGADPSFVRLKLVQFEGMLSLRKRVKNYKC